MKLVFTGTRNGMTVEQQRVVRDFLMRNQQFTNFTHGDCVGADVDFHNLVRGYRKGSPIITYRVLGPLCAMSEADLAIDGESHSHLSRNRRIVDMSKFLIGTPSTSSPTKRGGTWYTLRYGQKRGKDGLIVYPDGRTEDLKTADLDPKD